jgi:hypothetical protein
MVRSIQAAVAAIGVMLSLTAFAQNAAKVVQKPAATTPVSPVTPKVAPWLQQVISAAKSYEPPTLSTVPELEKMTQNDASAALERQNLRGVFLNKAGNETWRVALQSLPANTQTKRGTVVNVTLGPPVPLLTGRTLADATSILTAAGLQMGVTTEQGDPTAVPMIFRQDPAAHTYAVVNSGVAVWLPPLSSPLTGEGEQPPPVAGANRVKMPDVRRYTYYAAVLALRRLDLRGMTAGGHHAGTVQAQSISPGTMVDKNTTVTLTMGIVIPDVEGLSLTDADEELEKDGLQGLHAGAQTSTPGGSLIVASQAPAAGAIATTDLNVTLTVKRSTDWILWGVALAGLAVAGLVVKKVFFHPVGTEFRSKTGSERGEPVNKVAPRVKFELRSQRNDGKLVVTREPQVKRK